MFDSLFMQLELLLLDHSTVPVKMSSAAMFK